MRFFSFYPSQQAALSAGSRVPGFGEVRGGFFGAEMVHPRFHKVGDDDPLPTEMPRFTRRPQASATAPCKS